MNHPNSRTFKPLHLAVMLFGFLVLAIILLTLDSATGYSGDTSEWNGLRDQARESGCYCHGASSLAEDDIHLDFPEEGYQAGETINLTVRISGGPDSTGEHKGGFFLSVKEGTLAAVDDTVAISQNKKDAVHNSKAIHNSSGNGQREWTIQWTAPQWSTPTYKTNFILRVNSVNGDGSLNNDQWIMKDFECSNDGNCSGEVREQRDWRPWVLLPTIAILAFLTWFNMQRVPRDRRRE